MLFTEAARIAGCTKTLAQWYSRQHPGYGGLGGSNTPTVPAVRQLLLSRACIRLIKSKGFILIWGRLTLYREKPRKKKGLNEGKESALTQTSPMEDY